VLKVITAGDVAQGDVGRAESDPLEGAALSLQALPPRRQRSQFSVGRVDIPGAE
jgi:hypothetical protein